MRVRSNFVKGYASLPVRVTPGENLLDRCGQAHGGCADDEDADGAGVVRSTLQVTITPPLRIRVASSPRAVNIMPSPSYCASNAPGTGVRVSVLPSSVTNVLPLSSRALKVAPSLHV